MSCHVCYARTAAAAGSHEQPLSIPSNPSHPMQYIATYHTQEKRREEECIFFSPFALVFGGAGAASRCNSIRRSVSNLANSLIHPSPRGLLRQSSPSSSRCCAYGSRFSLDPLGLLLSCSCPGSLCARRFFNSLFPCTDGSTILMLLLFYMVIPLLHKFGAFAIYMLPDFFLLKLRQVILIGGSKLILQRRR